MSKKKSKKKQKKIAREHLLNQIKDIHIDDRWINDSYEELFDEIAIYQYELYKADKKFLENKSKKKNKHKKGKSVFYADSKPVKKRNKIVKKLEKKSFFDRVISLIDEIKPLAKVISRIVVLLLMSILNISTVRENISTSTMNKIDTVYRVCMSF